MVRKALFQDDSKAETGVPAEIHRPIEAAKEIKREADSPQKNLKCDVTFEYTGNEEPAPTSVVSKPSACSVSCLSAGNGEEMQAVCTVNIKTPGRTPQEAASENPVHVNLLLNESGWEAVQVDGVSAAKVREVDISLCKCARAMTLKCCVGNARPSKEAKEAVEHKFSAVLSDLGLKNKDGRLQSTDSAHVQVDKLKNKNSQLTIRSFFAGKGAVKVEESTKVPVKSNGEPCEF